MQKYLFKSFGFLLFAFGIYIIFVICIGEFGDEKFKKNLAYKRGGAGHTYSRLRDAEKISNVDLLIFGTSLAFKGYDTRIFEENGIRAFNLGTAGETPIQTEFMVKRYAKDINPNLVIYEINPEWFTTNRIESAVDIVSNLPNIDLGVLKMVLRVNNIKLYNNLIYSTYRANLLNDNDYYEPAKEYGEVYVPKGGFVENRMMYYSPEEIEPTKLLFKSEQVKAFERTVNYLKKNKINYILVMPPLSENRYRSFLNIGEINKYFADKGVYKNFNSLSLIDSLHFGDSRHLNQDGVVIFNKEVIHYLKRHPELFD